MTNNQNKPGRIGYGRVLCINNGRIYASAAAAARAIGCDKSAMIRHLHGYSRTCKNGIYAWIDDDMTQAEIDAMRSDMLYDEYGIIIG